ncbi:MAG: Nif3-like dinuclear metal center hexameric protein [Candidatus Bipolaricaulaceae bacterium]
MDTKAIMALALEMAGLSAVPADSAIHVPGDGIRKILVGIDLEGPELLWAKENGFDLVITHHPPGGPAALNFWQVLLRHVELMKGYGVPEAVAQAAAAELVRENRWQNQARNYLRLPEFAKRLGIAYMNIHTPLDELGRRRLVQAVGEVSPAAPVAELIGHLRAKFGEFQKALTAIEVAVGSSQNALGKVAVIHGAGTNGGYPVAKALFDHGVDTVIYIHIRPHEAHRLAQEYGGKGKNLVVTGHIASDSLGINPFLAELRARGLLVETLDVVAP